MTTRLHCPLPCLALQTPVLLIGTAKDAYRFSGLLDLLRHCSAEVFQSGKDRFALDAPRDNSKAYLALRSELTRKVVRSVTGRNRKSPLRPFLPTASLDFSLKPAQRQHPASFVRGSGTIVIIPRASRADVFRDVAVMFLATGEPGKARRLLELAAARQPKTADERRLLSRATTQLKEEACEIFRP